MRTPVNTVVASLALALVGCVPSTTVVRQPPAPKPLPTVIEPLEVDVARPHNGKIYIQTNRPAYVAIFDVVPERGVALVYPVSARQRRFVVSGLREVPVWWEPSRVTYHGAGVAARRSDPARYVYVLASDRPLRLSDEAFGNDYLYTTLGARVYRATNPYATMRALARQFLPPVAEEAWAEDAHAISRSYATERYRVVRVYCRDGSMYEVSAEFADRLWCGTRSRGVPGGPGREYDVDLTSDERPLRPDSVVGDNGRHLAVRSRGENGRGPARRVQEPPGWENRANGEDEKIKDEKVKEEKVKKEKVKNDSPGHAHEGNKPPRGSNGKSEGSDNRAQDAPTPRDAAVGTPTPMPRGPSRLPERASIPQAVAKAAKEAKAEKNREQGTGNRERSERADTADRAETPATKPQPKAESNAEPKAESNAEPKAEEKSQAPSDKRREPEKGRGKPNASDDKSAEKKSKDGSEAKPLT